MNIFGYLFVSKKFKKDFSKKTQEFWRKFSGGLMLISSIVLYREKIGFGKNLFELRFTHLPFETQVFSLAPYSLRTAASFISVVTTRPGFSFGFHSVK